MWNSQEYESIHFFYIISELIALIDDVMFHNFCELFTHYKTSDLPLVSGVHLEILAAMLDGPKARHQYNKYKLYCNTLFVEF